MPLQGKQSDKLAQAVIDVMSGIKSQVLTITYDNGKEFADHELMAKALETDIYFAHPYASWERGINENTNGLIRQYFPKGMDLRDVTMEQAQYVSGSAKQPSKK